MKNTSFVTGEHYHVYNRGVDKRNIFSDKYDLERFLQSMEAFNAVAPIGSIYERAFDKKFGRETSKSEGALVEFVAYCLNPNHFHFIVSQLVDGGISEFMKRMGGYTKYFNEKYKRSGALFQGTFKSKLIDSNEYLLYLSVYVNLNDRAHQFGRETSKLMRSSWREYERSDAPSDEASFCNKKIVLEQFKNFGEYQKFAGQAMADIVDNKVADREFQELRLE